MPESSGGSYTQGNGISISGTQISARLSSQSGNQVRFGPDGGIYVPQSSGNIPVATTYSLGGVIIGRGLSVDGDGYLSVDGALSSFIHEIYVSGNFDGETSISIGGSTNSLTNRDIFGRSFVAVFASVSNRGSSQDSTMGVTFGNGYPIIEDINTRPSTTNNSSVALYYRAYQSNPSYYVIGLEEFYGTGFTMKSSAGTGSYRLRIQAFGVPLNPT